MLTMKQRRICFSARAWLAGLLVLPLAAGSLHAAGTKETRLYQSGSKKLQDGFWSLAEADFTEFLKAYPESELFADVVIKKAQAQFKEKKFDELIGGLDAQQARAGKSADEFAYWKAEANYYKGNCAAAADAFDQLARDFPESARRLDALVESADARAKLEDWARVVESLGRADGAFQQMARTNLTDTNAVRGLFLLSQAESARKDYAAAEKSLAVLAGQKLRPEWEWGRQYLLCDLLLAQGRAEQAWNSSSNLLNAAEGRADLLAESMAMRGEILERLDKLPDAIKSYETNLASDTPDVRRNALLRIVELNLRQDELEAASTRLRNYLAAHPNEKDSDLERLTLGELALRRFFQTNTNTGQPEIGANLAEAMIDFQKVIDTTNSPLAGKAWLNLGWGFWAGGKVAESGIAFSNAIPRLPAFSEDQAVARFKFADALYEQKDFPGAIAGYKSVISAFDTNAEMKIAARFKVAETVFPPPDFPAQAANQPKIAGAQYDTQAAIKDSLFERALYQIVRAGVETTNLVEATNALDKILTWFPDRLLGQPGMLLVGQALERSQGAAAARAVFSDFAARFPQSALLPEVKLAMARTYEAERNWPAAIGQYDEWVKNYSGDPALPRAEFSRAGANYADGRETNAFGLYTNFVVRFQSNAVAVANELLPAAKFWIGDYYWQREEFGRAEASYQEVFQKWPNSEMAFRATMMAGKAAVARVRPDEAIKLYFKTLAGNSNCPLELRLQARFAIGDADVAIYYTATNLDPVKEAVVIFSEIADAYPTNKLAPLARGRLGDCYRLLAAADPSQYQFAINAYERVITNELANITPRSAAAYGVALSFEDMARLKPADERTPLYRRALDSYLNIYYYNKNLRENEHPDMKWVEQAGLSAGKLLELLGDWNSALHLYESMANELPALRPGLEIRAARVRKELTSAKD
jgi:outer membrane protein assembly factor BamD (BamD/ComL family)